MGAKDELLEREWVGKDSTWDSGGASGRLHLGASAGV